MRCGVLPNESYFQLRIAPRITFSCAYPIHFKSLPKQGSCHLLWRITLQSSRSPCREAFPVFIYWCAVLKCILQPCLFPSCSIKQTGIFMLNSTARMTIYLVAKFLIVQRFCLKSVFRSEMEAWISGLWRVPAVFLLWSSH